METLTIDKKKFVVIEQKEFDRLQLMAARKTESVKNYLCLQEKIMHIN